MISIAYETEFTICNRLLSPRINACGAACARVRCTDTHEVIKEVTDVGAEDALELYEKLVNVYAKCENCMMPCCTH